MQQLITGYLPSVIFMFFFYLVPPTMMVFSTLEGAISRSGRKRSTCIKVVYFFIWNLFFANILTEAAIDHYQVSITNLGDPKNIPNLLAKAVPATVICCNKFFCHHELTQLLISNNCCDFDLSSTWYKLSKIFNAMLLRHI